MRLLLLTRPDCDLCAEFRAELEQAFPDCEVDEACVDDRPEWRQRYGLKIPVLLDEQGAVLCSVRFDPGALA